MLFLFKLIAAHILADFYLQPDYIAQNKGKSIMVLTVHSLINAVAAYLVLAQFALWWIPVIVFVTHFLIDWVKIKYGNDGTKWFVGDQLLHLVVIASLWILMTGEPWLLIEKMGEFLGSVTIWKYIIAYSLMTIPSSLLIERIFRNWSDNIPQMTGLPGGGKWIGYMERFLILTFISSGNILAVGFLVTAKSVFRFSDIKSSSDFRITEYVLLGTLVSFCIAIFTGFILL